MRVMEDHTGKRLSAVLAECLIENPKLEIRIATRKSVFFQNHLQIILPVQQFLLSHSPRKQIKKLYVHPQSLAQCKSAVLLRCWARIPNTD